MPLDLTDERRAFVAAVRDFVARECATREQRDRLTDGGREVHSPELYAKLAELGWLGISIPEQYGGGGLGMVDLCLFLEETSYGQAPIGGFGVSMISASAYERFGTEQQKRTVLSGVVQGRVEAISMSEPGAGSDVAALVCRADQHDGGYVINGQKTWCSEAHAADHILLIARTSRDGTKHEGLTQFMVPADAPGLEIRDIDTMGGREVSDLFFTDCFVPADAVVGTPGQAWGQLMTGLNLERMIIAAMMLGTARRAFDDTLAYVKQREQFGQPIGRFQVLRHRLADLATEIECCRLLVYDVAAKIDADPGTPLPREASMAKLKTSEVAKHAALEGMQMLGGYGYATEYGMERLLRATLPATVFGGSSEIQRDIIGKTFGL